MLVLLQLPHLHKLHSHVCTGCRCIIVCFFCGTYLLFIYSDGVYVGSVQLLSLLDWKTIGNYWSHEVTHSLSLAWLMWALCTVFRCGSFSEPWAFWHNTVAFAHAQAWGCHVHIIYNWCILSLWQSFHNNGSKGFMLVGYRGQVPTWNLDRCKYLSEYMSYVDKTQENLGIRVLHCVDLDSFS